MLQVIKILFWTSLFLLLYTYLGYPLLSLLIIKIRKIAGKGKIAVNKALLPVTLVIAAYNEEKIIKDKIINSLALDYPAELLNLIFITDGSSDKTPAIVGGYPGIRLLHQQERKGKPAAMNRAMKTVNTPITIFSDANTLLNKSCIRKIVAHYHDPLVGGVAGEKKIIGNSKGNAVSRGEGLYWKYESFLKKTDSRLYTAVGAAGELFSIRTSLYTDLPENTIIEDFVQSLLLCKKGYRVRYEPEAFSEEKGSVSLKDEMERKIRISAGAFQAMGMLRQLFNIIKFPAVSFLFISHRVLRWTVCPLSLIVLFISSVILYFETNAWWYAIAAIIQTILYMTALAGWLLARGNIGVKAFYPPFYFLFMNFCVLAGFVRFIQKKQSVLWNKAEREE